MPRYESATISMNLVQSSGTWLRGCLQPQHYYVSIGLKDIDGRIIAQAGLSYEQAAKMLLYSGDVACTLERYRSETGELISEKIEPPKTVHRRMNERLSDSNDALLNRLYDVERDLVAMVDGNERKSKGKLQELVSAVNTIRSHLKANTNFIVQQAEEELGEMQNNAAGQLAIHLQRLGVSIDEPEKLSTLIPTGAPTNLIADKATPVKDDYELKERKLKPVEEMNARQVAEEISVRFRIIERRLNQNDTNKSGQHSILYNANASEHKGPKVSVLYVGYQGNHMLSMKEARDYLAYLRNLKVAEDFKTHWHYKG